MNSTIVESAPNEPDYAAIKTKQRSAWGAGDYGRVGVLLQITGEQLAEAMDLRAGASVLDVAAGNGNATLAAARRFCNVVSTDYVESLLEQSRKRTEAEGLTVEYRQADAEDLPFDDNSFDNVMSTFGVMFTPNQARSASEMIRVCKPGGRIGIANWTPAGFIGRLFKTIGQYVAPPPGVRSPGLWGTEEFLAENFGPFTANVDTRSRMYCFRFRSPQHWLDLFATYYGPLLKAFDSLDETKARALSDDVLALIDEFNTADDGTMVVPSEYLEVVVTR